MSRVWFLGMGIGLVVFSLLASPVEAARSATVKHAKYRTSKGSRAGERVVLHAASVPVKGPIALPASAVPASAGPAGAVANPALMDRGRMETRLTPSESPKPDGNVPTGSKMGLSYLDIEVSHSAHQFWLYANFASGKREKLYECKVGLGSPEFPTPVGIYYVTHIYDQDPWWIPPPDRWWAAGQRPSRKVYGGTMAPLLKKRPVRVKKHKPDPEDKIAGPVQLDDYGYRFHGTNAPRSIGQNQSHGCVRMRPDDARKVAGLIREYVGQPEHRAEDENGSYFILNAPVRLNLGK
ncbi:MAG: L,D-transpeptidase [Desulfomonilaceae bacterium]